MSRARVLAGNVQVTGALLLVLGYLQDVFLTLQAMSLQRDEQGLWTLVVDAEGVSQEWAVLAFLMVFCGLLAFGGGWLIKRLSQPEQPEQRTRKRLSMRDLLMAFGWVGLAFFGGLFAWSFGLHRLIPAEWTHSTGVAALSSAYMQLVAIIVIPLYYRKRLSDIGLRRPVLSWKMLGYVLMFFIFTYAMSILTNIVGSWLGINTNSYREQNISEELHAGWAAVSWLTSFMPLITTSLIAPIGEELLFRGALQSTLCARLGGTAGVLLSSFLFALIHADLVLFVPIFLIGLLLGVIYRITGTLWAPIWLHIVNNLYASILDLI